MEFFWQEYWSGLPFPTPGDLTIPWPRDGSCISCIGKQILYHLCRLGFHLFLKSRSFYAWQNPSIGSKAHFPFIFNFHHPPLPDVNPPQVSRMHSGNCLNTPLSTWYLTFSINCCTLLWNRHHLEILKPSFPSWHYSLFQEKSGLFLKKNQNSLLQSFFFQNPITSLNTLSC